MEVFYTLIEPFVNRILYVCCTKNKEEKSYEKGLVSIRGKCAADFLCRSATMAFGVGGKL